MSVSWEELKVNAGIYGKRVKIWLRTLIRLAGVLTVIFGALLFFKPSFTDPVLLMTERMYLRDSMVSLLLMAIGGLVAYKL